MIARDDAIHAAATISGAPFDQVRSALDRFLDSLLQLNHKTLRDLGIYLQNTERKARRRRHIVNALNRTKENRRER
jgi:hypothetical protein